MENAYHALIMAGAIIVFVVATSIGLYTYNRILYANDQILTESEYFDRTAENFALSQFANDTDRVYSGAEVAMQVINMYEGKDFSFKKITIAGVGTFRAPTIASDAEGLNNMATEQMNSVAPSLESIRSSEFIVSSLTYEEGKGVSVNYTNK